MLRGRLVEVRLVVIAVDEGEVFGGRQLMLGGRSRGYQKLLADGDERIAGECPVRPFQCGLVRLYGRKDVW